MEQELTSLKQEVASFQLQVLPRLQALETAIAQLSQSHTTLERLGVVEETLLGQPGNAPGLVDRVETLETARSKQIEINTKLLADLEARSKTYQPPVNAQPTKSWFKWK